MAMVVSTRSKVLTAVVVTLFGVALLMILGSVLGWFDAEDSDFAGPAYNGMQQRHTSRNLSQVLVCLRTHRTPVRLLLGLMMIYDII